jgi:hypothetical protein
MINFIILFLLFLFLLTGLTFHVAKLLLFLGVGGGVVLILWRYLKEDKY